MTGPLNRRSRHDSPKDSTETFRRAIESHRAGNLAEAERGLKLVLRAQPDHFGALHLLGGIEAQRGHFEKARRLVKQALEIDPRSAEAHSTYGDLLCELKRFDEALVSYDAALAIRPDDARALCNRGVVSAELRRPEDALECYDKALTIRPGYALALYNRGNALHDLKRPEEALTSYDRALAIKPDHAEAHYNRGNVLQALKRSNEALASYDRALTIRPDYAEALNNGGNALLDLQRPADAVRTFRRLLEVAPDHEFARGSMFFSQLRCCDWTHYDLTVKKIADDVAAGRRAALPFAFLMMSRSPAAQLRCAQIYARHKYPPPHPPLRQGERYGHDRIRIAYLSANFHEHAIAYLMADLFETHDKARFETTAISFGRVTAGKMRERLTACFDQFVDVRNESDRSVAALVRDLEIDILIDLMGYTLESRPGITACRPAPIQVNYLGYPGTMGTHCIDYIIADRFVIPEDHQAYYTEKVAYLPHYYPVNDAKPYFAERTPSRSEFGLPPDGFVFCCFNNNYKITPEIFDIWMRLLHKVDGSVLWLLADNDTASRNLRREAEKRGIESRRLIFAPRVRLEDHLARNRVADLFLDTPIYNAHTTAGDALWAGLPVVTCLGSTLVGRVAASLLHAAGLPELVTPSPDLYESCALRLATDGDALADIRARLAHNQGSYPLFDPQRFRRHIEAAYLTMWQRHERTEPITSFAIEPTGLETVRLQ